MEYGAEVTRVPGPMLLNDPPDGFVVLPVCKKRIIAIIREHCPDIGMIVLFGSYARGDWQEAKDLAPDRKSGHPSDYDILAITLDEKQSGSHVWQAISDTCSEAGLSATPRFIHHDISFVNMKLERGQYFFSDLVFTGYIPDEHYLAILSARAAHIDPNFRTIFEAQNDFEHNAFTALEFAYIGARYEKRYTIDEPTVSYLAKRVEALLRLTEMRCREKIAALQRAVDS